MAKVFLFMWQSYYPQGGISDLIGSYETFGEAQRIVETCADLLRKAGEYPGIDDYWAEIATIDTHGDLYSMARFDHGEWHPKPDAPPTLESQADPEKSSLSRLLLDYLNPDRIAERKVQAESESAERTRKAEIDRLYKELGTVLDDAEAKQHIKTRLSELGEPLDAI